MIDIREWGVLYLHVVKKLHVALVLCRVREVTGLHCTFDSEDRGLMF
jgi:hypothetical protein